MNNEEVMNAITWYQSQKTVHPATCGVNSRHELFVPRVDGDVLASKESLHLGIAGKGHWQDWIG